MLLLLLLLFLCPVLISKSFVFTAFLVSTDNLSLDLIHVPIEIKVNKSFIQEAQRVAISFQYR